GSGGAAYPLQLGDGLKDWVEAPDTEAYRSLDSRELIAGILSGFITRYALPESTRDDYLSSYEGDRFVETMRYPRAYPTDLPILADLLPEIETPVQIINRAHDPRVPPANAGYVAHGLARRKCGVLVPRRFGRELRPGECAAASTSGWADASTTF